MRNAADGIVHRSSDVLACAAAGGAATAGGWPALLAASVAIGVLKVALNTHRSGLLVGVVSVAGADPVPLRRRDVDRARIANHPETASWRLTVPHSDGTLELTGDAALRVCGVVMAFVNAAGAPPTEVDDAVRRIESAGSAERLFAAAAGGPRYWAGFALHELPTDERLALEMVTHEEEERRAMEGELAALEAAWREAEEIGAIADGMLLPRAVLERLARLRGRGG